MSGGAVARLEMHDPCTGKIRGRTSSGEALTGFTGRGQLAHEAWQDRAPNSRVTHGLAWRASPERRQSCGNAATQRCAFLPHSRPRLSHLARKRYCAHWRQSTSRCLNFPGPLRDFPSAVPGFYESVRGFIAQTLVNTFARVTKRTLADCLKLEGATLDQYVSCRGRGWVCTG